MTLKIIKDLLNRHTNYHYTQRSFFQKVFPKDMLNAPSGLPGDLIDISSNSSSNWLSKLYNGKPDIKSGEAKVRRILSENIKTDNRHLKDIASNCKELLPEDSADIDFIVSKLVTQIETSHMTSDMAQYLNGLLHSVPHEGLAACIVCSCCDMDDQSLLEQLKKVYSPNPTLPVPQDASLEECLKYLQTVFNDYYAFITPRNDATSTYEPQGYNSYKLESCRCLITHVTQEFNLPQELSERINSIYRKIEFLDSERELRPDDATSQQWIGKFFHKIYELEQEINDFSALWRKHLHDE